MENVEYFNPNEKINSKLNQAIIQYNTGSFFGEGILLNTPSNFKYM